MQKEQNYDDELIATQVKALMERNAITKRHQVSQLSHILKLSFSHAHRKLKGESPWTLSQISDVARHFGESASSLIEIAESADSGLKPLHEALLVLESPKELRCFVRLAGPVTDRCSSEYVATCTNDDWRVFPSDQAGSLVEPYLVEFIEILPKISATDARIAVVDDELDSADNLCDYLSEHGFKTNAFYAVSTFKQGYQNHTGEFDAYVIDWWLGDETAEQCIREIRELGATQAPIFLLTGELKTGKANETDINRVMRTYNITCVEKPIRMSLLVGNIEKELRMHS